ncbi:hypothetical protein [Streptomyces sp. 2P-4]|uniref:hypothetical protein n=1 Tax=Streptomyces sp. 2P-4 TaxID=2931974 RepID=UPI002541CE7E|nr:hypothetical protein [Streptomyces sp. 2P-4]
MTRGPRLRLPAQRTPASLAAAALTAVSAACAVAAAAAAPALAGESLITVIDNSHADSIVEVDRSANLQNGSGTSGSDHDGSAVDVLQALVASAPAPLP